MEIPITTFETTGGSSFTSLAEEEVFIDQVVAGSDLAYKIQIGASALGRPIHAVVLGAPVPKPWSELSSVMLVVASQHGNEETPREAALQLIRNLAFYSDQEDMGHLSTTPVVIIPTSNPDGTISGARSNGRGVDINRDHLFLSQPESTAIASVITTTNPLFIYDGHEWGNATTPLSIGQGLEVALPPLATFAKVTRVSMENWFPEGTIREYPTTGHKGTLQSAATHRGFPVMLVETDSKQSATARCSNHLTSMTNLYRYISDNRNHALLARDDAWDIYQREGRFAYAPYYGHESGPIPAKKGYWVPRSADLMKLQRLGVKYREDASSGVGGAYVTMAQAASGVIPLILDPIAPRPIAVGEPIEYRMGYSEGILDGVYPPGLIVNINGYQQVVSQLIAQLGDVRSVVWGSF